MTTPAIHYQASFTHVVEVEGGYSNHKSDTGGATMWGITEAVARANGYTGRMQDLTKDQARAIYKSQYWDELKGDLICMVSPEIMDKLFDIGVNMGTSRAATFLQRALNVFNARATLYSDMKVDGNLGPVSVAALRAFIAKRGKDGIKVMLRAINSQQGVKYIEFSEAKESQEDFVFGWFNNRVK